MYFFKIKKFCYAKDIVKRMRRQAMDWESIFAKDVTDKNTVIQDLERVLETQQ